VASANHLERPLSGDSDTVNGVSHINGGMQNISLAPGQKRDNRASTLDSAVQAEGIFDLYGEEGSEPSARNSQYLEQEVVVPHPDYHNNVEILDSPGSPASWSGPFSALRSSRHTSLLSPPDTINANDTHTPQQQSQTLTIPQLTLTPDKNHLRESTLTSYSTSTSISVSPSPTHPSISRLSPRLNRYVDRSRNGSTVSFGSAQYPGEEDDSFHVRSTCTFYFLLDLGRKGRGKGKADGAGRCEIGGGGCTWRWMGSRG
jgi:hypothetical protein